MRKFAKILALIIALAAMLTAFCVVSLAEEEEALTPFTVHEFDFENTTLTDNAQKIGLWSIYTSDNGENKYMVGEYAAASGGAVENKDIKFDDYGLMGNAPVENEEYAIQKYPVFAFDFDVMSTTGAYAHSTVRFDIYGDTTDKRLTQSTTHYFSGLKLSKTAYEWQHVTLILTYLGDGKFVYNSYVNGVKTTLNSEADYSSIILDENGNLKYDNVRVACVSIYPERNSEALEQKICFDNFKFTYYPDEYAENLDLVAGYFYDENYELPYGRTVATLTDKETSEVTQYDNFEEAFNDAKKDNVLTLLADTSEAYVITKEINVNTNGFAFEYTSSEYVPNDPEADVLEFISLTDKYDGVYVDTKGVSHYFVGYKGFEDAIQSAIDTANYNYKNIEALVTLFDDIEYYKSFTFPRYLKIAIDLNGHTLTRINLYGQAYNYNSETSSYTQTATTSAPNAFVCPRDLVFAIRSSAPGGEFVTASVNGDAYYDANGVLESYTAKSVLKAGLLAGTAAPMYTRLTLENIDIYSEMLFTSAHSSTKDFQFTMRNCRFYKTIGSDAASYAGGADYHRGCFFLNAGADTTTKSIITFEDSLFYIPDGSVKASNQYYQFLVLGDYASFIEVNFDGCDIISDNDGFGILLSNTNQTVNFTDCNVYGINHYSTTKLSVNFGAGNSTSLNIANEATYDSAISAIDKTHSIVYNLPTNSRVTLDATDKTPVFDFAFEDRAVEFVKRTGATADLVDVSWLDMDGNTVATTNEFKGDVATPPANVKIPSGNSYTAFTNPDWINSEETADLTVIDGENAFSATLPENPEYVAYVTDIRFSLSYYGQFAYRIYVPVVEGIEVTKLGAYSPGNTNFTIVKIDGVSYYASVDAWQGVGKVLENSTADVYFTIDGVDYHTSFTVNALIYANLLCQDPLATDVEIDAIFKMVSYVEQVYLYHYGSISDATQQKIDNFFGTYYNTENPKARPAYIDYNESEVYEIDPSIDDYVTSFNYAIYSASRMAFGITLKQELVDQGYRVVLSGITNGKVNTAVTNKENGTVTYYTDNTSIADAILSAKYTVKIVRVEVITSIDPETGNTTVRDGEIVEDNVASTSYSLATYCDAVDSPLANSLYTFGMAIRDVRAYLRTL